MNVTIVLEIAVSEWGSFVYKTIDVEDLDVILVDCIQDYLGGDRFISFNDYYSDSYIMLHKRVFPFIMRDRSYHWYVPYRDATIREFMITNDIPEGGQIKVEVDQYGGYGDGSLLTILEWIRVIGESVGYFTFYYRGLDFICNHFIGENRQMIDFYDIADMLHRKVSWKLKDVMCITEWSDENLVEIILNRAGYRYVDGKFVFDEKCWNNMIEGAIEAEDPWAVDPILVDYETVAACLADINKAITALKYQKEEDANKYYNKARKMADQVKERWPETICRGHQFRYLRIRKKAKPLAEKTLKRLEKDVLKISDRITEIVFEYEENHRQEVDFDPPMVG